MPTSELMNQWFEGEEELELEEELVQADASFLRYRLERLPNRPLRGVIYG